MGIKRNLTEAGILENKEDKITEDEAALYDRQIRLWGIDCQKRLKEAKILILGLNGVAAEIIKNLTLSGVKAIAIMDDKVATPADTTAQFFLASYKPGEKRAEASVSSIRELNPNVDISVVSGDVYSQDDDFFKGFVAMIATDATMDVLIKLNEFCRKYDIQFYCTETWGFYGYFFLDLNVHSFKCCGVGFPTQKGEKRRKEEIQPRDMTKKYCLLGPTMMTKVGEGLRKRVNKVFILLHVLNHFREHFERYPKAESRADDITELKKLRTIVCTKLDYDESKISDEMLGSVFGELSPVCAAVGGTLANEIIKGISKIGLPVYNFFFFDGNESVGSNEAIVVA